MWFLVAGVGVGVALVAVAGGKAVSPALPPASAAVVRGCGSATPEVGGPGSAVPAGQWRVAVGECPGKGSGRLSGCGGSAPAGHHLQKSFIQRRLRRGPLLTRPPGACGKAGLPRPRTLPENPMLKPATTAPAAAAAAAFDWVVRQGQSIMQGVCKEMDVVHREDNVSHKVDVEDT